MDVGRLTSIDRPVARSRRTRVRCNRREDYLRRIAAAQGHPRLQVAHAADAVRAASKDLSGEQAGQVVTALLALAGFVEDPEMTAVAARLLELAGRHPAAASLLELAGRRPAAA